MIERADVVIVGAGAFGTSTAYHLAVRGHRRIVLLDAHEPVSQSSPRAAGLTKQIRSHEALSRLAVSSVDALRRFTAETGEPLTCVQAGSVHMARTPESAAVLRAEIGAAKAWGVELYEISAEDASRLAPAIQPRNVQVMTYIPSDVYLEEPKQLPLGYLRAAARLGVDVRAGTRVTGIGISGGRVRSVATARGRIETPMVIDAAGAWAALVAAQAGINIPLVPVRHQLYILGPVARVQPTHSMCRIYDAAVYLRPHGDGLLIGGYESNPRLYDMRMLPDDFQIRDLDLDRSVLERLTDLVRVQVPLTADVAIREHRGGLPTMTADGRPLLGPVPGVDGLLAAAGCCVGGLSISPAVGQALADLIQERLPASALQPFSIGRFDPALQDDRLREACVDHYRNWYAEMPHTAIRAPSTRGVLESRRHPQPRGGITMARHPAKETMERSAARSAAGEDDGVVYVNGAFLPARQATISVFDHGLLYGDGVYDTLMAWNGYIFKLDPHLDRLLRSCRAVKIVPPADRGRLRELIIETVRRSGLRNTYVKCVVSRGTSPAPLLDPRQCTPGLFIFAVPYPASIDPMRPATGIRAKITAVRRTPHDVVDSRIKSLNYLPFVLARLEAIEAGYDEALMCDAQGNVCEAPGWNLFVVREERVGTPGTSILEGITRETVLELCRRMSIPCEAHSVTAYDLWTADEAFLTSTAGGIVPLTDVDGRTVGNGRPGPVYQRIVGEFRGMLERGEHGTAVPYQA